MQVKGGLAKLCRHLWIMGDYSAPDIAGLKAGSERFIDGPAAKLGVNGISGICVRIGKSFVDTVS